VDITWPPIDVIQQQKIDQQLEAAMEELKPLCERLISFGSYPIADDTSLP
jgi:prephenate dehydratase